MISRPRVRGEEETYDKGGTLLLVGARKVGHGVEDLDAGVLIDMQCACVVRAVAIQLISELYSTNGED